MKDGADYFAPSVYTEILGSKYLLPDNVVVDLDVSVGKSHV